MQVPCTSIGVRMKESYDQIMKNAQSFVKPARRCVHTQRAVGSELSPEQSQRPTGMQIVSRRDFELF